MPGAASPERIRTIGSPIVPNAHVSEAVEDAFGRENVVGINEIGDELCVCRSCRPRLARHGLGNQDYPEGDQHGNAAHNDSNGRQRSAQVQGSVHTHVTLHIAVRPRGAGLSCISWRAWRSRGYIRGDRHEILVREPFDDGLHERAVGAVPGARLHVVHLPHEIAW